MKNLTADNITEAVQRTFANSPDERLREVMSAFVRHVHDFAREVNLTREEWLAAHEFLMRAGAISDERRSEFMLTSDVLGLSSLVDFLDQSDSGSSEASVLGPFYEADAPMLEVGGDLKGDNPGEPVWFEGRVLSEAGAGIAGVMVEIWQTAANGLYDSQDPKQPQPNFRCRMLTDPGGRYAFQTVRPQPYTVLSEAGAGIAGVMVEIWQTAANGLYDSQDPKQPQPNFRCRMLTDPGGRYAFQTVRPQPYTVPHDGPIGDLLTAIKKHPWRPAHIHFRLSAEGYQTLVTELFDQDDQYIAEDCVFGVRESLVTRYQPDGAGYRVAYDFRLAGG